MNARDYIALVRERKLIIALCVLACLGLAAVVTSLMPKSYTSTVTFYLSSEVTSEEGAGDPFLTAQLPAERAASFAELLTGPRVAADAAEQLGGGITGAEVADSVAAGVEPESVVLTLTATGDTAERARDVAQAVSDSFVALVAELETGPAPAEGEEAAPAPPVAVVADVLQPADLPDSPTSPSLLLNLLIGLAVGLLVGVTAAVARHALDTRLRSARQLAEAVGAPVLGAVPADRKAAEHPVALTAESADARRPHPRVEAYRRIRTALQAAQPGPAGGVLVVASARRGEGRTTTACNLAAFLAAVGARVVLVDGDLRHPRVTDVLGLDRGDAPGLGEVLSGAATLRQATLRWEPEYVDVIPGGAPTARSNELLASRRAQEALADLRTRYDYVVVDSSPVLSVADAASLARLADGVVLVGRWRRTRGPDAQAAAAYLRSVSAPVLGAVLTRVPRRRITPADLAAGAGTGTVAAPATRRPAADAPVDPGRAVAGPEPTGPPAGKPPSDRMGEVSPIPDSHKQDRRGGPPSRKRRAS
ncbi:polysaccharide biosynthesis tyrosine autokinase [Blastococcus sp. SYSU D00813]